MVNYRLCAQLPTRTVHDFPIDFLHRLLNGTTKSTLPEEAILMHKDIFKSNVLLMPSLYKGDASMVLVVNPGGILLPDLRERAVPCIVILTPHGKDTTLNVKMVERRIRRFLNDVAKMDPSIESTKEFTRKNLKAYIPQGEL